VRPLERDASGTPGLAVGPGLCSNDRVSRGSDPTDSAALAAGRTHLTVVLGVMYVLSFAPILAAWLRGATDRAPTQVLMLALTAWLFSLVRRGVNWARNVTVALAFLAGVAGTLLGVAFSGTSDAGYLVFAVGLAFIACGFAIVALPSVNAYLDARRGGRT